jgi:hypothetical protein
MTAHTPNPTIVFVPVPAAGSPKYARALKPNYRRHKAQRPPNLPQQPIPKPVIDRAAVQRILDQGRKVLAEVHARG